jgi:hypothetical protein
MARRLSNQSGDTAVAERPETTEKKWISSKDLDEIRKRYVDKNRPSGIRVDLMKPFQGKESLPAPEYVEKEIGGQKTKIFKSYGEPRFFVNRTEVIMVFRGNQRVERRLFTTIKERDGENKKNPQGTALRGELQKAMIPGA